MEIDGVPVAEDEVDGFLNGDIAEVDRSVEIQNKTFLLSMGSLPGDQCWKARYHTETLCACPAGLPLTFPHSLLNRKEEQDKSGEHREDT